MKNNWQLTSRKGISLLLVRLAILLVYGIVCSAALVYANPGDLDTTFGSAGIVSMPIDQSPLGCDPKPYDEIGTFTRVY